MKKKPMYPLMQFPDGKFYYCEEHKQRMIIVQECPYCEADRIWAGKMEIKHRIENNKCTPPSPKLLLSPGESVIRRRNNAVERIRPGGSPPGNIERVRSTEVAPPVERIRSHG